MDAIKNPVNPKAPGPAGAGEPEEPWTFQNTLGCLRLLLVPALIALLFIATRVKQPWLTWTAIGLFLCYLGYRAWTTFRVPELNADGLVGGTPKVAPGIPAQVSDHIKRLGHVREGESVLAALDDSWKDDGSKGMVVTDRRFFTYQAAEIRRDIPFADVKSLFIRNWWYPGAGILGRGEIIGRGPVIVLRLKFRMTDGRFRRLRLSNYASDLHPVLSALLAKLGYRVEVGRTLPGI